MFDKAKEIIKEDACMKFYDKLNYYILEQMYLELD